MRNSRQTIGYGMVLMAGVMWGTIGLFVKLLESTGASPSLIAFMRILMGAVILGVFMLFRYGTKRFRLDRKGLLHCAFLGVFTQALFNYSYNLSIESVGVATASVLLYTAPIFVVILSSVLFKEKITLWKIAAIAIDIIACFFMVTNGDFSAMNIAFAGVAFGVLAGFLYSLVTIVGRIATGDSDPMAVAFYGFLFGALALAVLTRPWTEIPDVSCISFWLYSAGFGLIPTVGSYHFYFHGLTRDLELSRVPVIASIEPIISTVIGLFVFHEVWGYGRVIGILGVVSAIALISFSDLLRKSTSH